MHTSELIAQLQKLQAEIGGDPEVLCQSHGCCNHGHEIESVEQGSVRYRHVSTEDEVGAIVIRV